MRRLQLFEFEDLGWLPDGLRDVVTEWLQRQVVLDLDVYEPAADLLADLLRAEQTTAVVDLCSGAGGPWPHLKAQLERRAGPVELLFTDKFPNRPALARAVAEIGDGRTSYRTESLDATDPSVAVEGVLTVFTAFHHFRPEQARRILAAAAERGQAIAVFDFADRAHARYSPLTAVGALRTVHRLRPRRWWRLGLTYVLPVIPLVLAWDATVSDLRGYDTDDLRRMTDGLGGDDWGWRVGVLRAGDRPPVTYVIGAPGAGGHLSAP